MDIRKRQTLFRFEPIRETQHKQRSSESQQGKGDLELDISSLIMLWEQIRTKGLPTIPRYQRLRIIQILTTNVPQFKQLFKVNQDKFIDALKGFSLERLKRNDHLTNQDGSFYKVYLLLQGTVAIDFEPPDKAKFNTQFSTITEEHIRLLQPLTLIGNDLLKISTGQLIKKIYVKTNEAVVLTADPANFARITYGAIPNNHILSLIQSIKQCALLKNLTPHQIVELGFAGKVWSLEKNKIIVKQQKLMNQSLLSRKNTMDAFIYITLEGQFAFESMISAGSPDKLDLFRYLAKFNTTKDVPLMVDQSLYSLSPKSKQLQRSTQLSILGVGELIGISELMNDEEVWRYTLQVQDQGSKVLEIDLTNIGGWQQFSIQLGVDNDIHLNRFIRDTAQRLHNKLVDQEEVVERDGEKFGCIIFHKNQEFMIDQRRPKNKIEDNETKNKWQDPENIIEQVVEKKALIGFKIKNQCLNVNKKQRSLVEEFSECDPQFLKHLKIKIFSQAYIPHQDSIFSKIKSINNEKNHNGMYMHRVRKQSCADNSFLLFENYKRSTIKNSTRSVYSHEVNKPVLLTPNQINRASSAIKNVKRRLKNSRNSSRPITQNGNYDTESNSPLMQTQRFPQTSYNPYETQ